MERQRTLWPTDLPASAARGVWAGLDEQGRSRVLAALARLIAKAARGEHTRGKAEDSHEC